MRPSGSWVAATAVLVVLGCHDDGGCHWPWAKDDPDGGGDAEHGEVCEAADDCASSLVCAGDGICRYPGEPGTADQGDPCLSSQFCSLGLTCASTGVCASPGAPGTAGLGEECGGLADCELGLSCVQDACYGLPLPLWTGEECEGDDPGAFRAYFEVPAGQPVHDFYRLPFPNDARVRDDGTLDLTGHPTPGALIPALGDVVGTVFDLLEQDFAGFGNNQAVFFRFSDHIDYDTLERGHPHEGGTWGVVDLTPGATYGAQAAGGYATATSRGQYICDDWFAMSPAVGRGFLPGHTYAAYLGSAITAADDGAPLGQDPDFFLMLSTTPPGDARLTRAWTAYQPLRDWIAATEGLDDADFAAATVFTVGDPTEPVLTLREAVAAAPKPVESGLHLCTAAGGPYGADDASRGCDAVDPGFHEIQGLVGLPQFQQGTPPFKDVADGGGIDLSAGPPAVVRTEQVQFTLTIPKGATMPASGWPLVIYGHGTGGSATSAVREGLAAELSDVVLDDASHQRFATLTIDAPLHGPRRHEENWDEGWLAIDPNAYGADVLYFNPINPRAARDNALQAVADHQALLRWAVGIAWDASTSPTGSPLWFDEDRVYYLGHSQGSTAGVAFVAYEPGVAAAVFSGAGGLLAESLSNKTLPYDMPAAIAIGLADPDIDRYNPVINLVQGGAERSDGVNHAPHVAFDPLGTDAPRDVFQVFGVGDHYTPDETQEALARALRVSQVPNGYTPIGGLPTASLPAFGNADGTTAITVLYGPPGADDAHFVLFDRDDTMRQVTHFFGTAARDGTPTVVTP